MQEAIKMLQEAGRSDLLTAAATAEVRPSRARPPHRRASEGVAAAVFACSPPREKMLRGEVSAGEEQGECRTRAAAHVDKGRVVPRGHHSAPRLPRGYN